jgi:hypothetical protein
MIYVKDHADQTIYAVLLFGDSAVLVNAERPSKPHLHVSIVTIFQETRFTEVASTSMMN